MPEPFDFAQKIALVAGGTGGLGAPIAAELRARGCIVTTVSRSPISDTAHISADLRSPDAISAVMNSIVERHGGVDIVVNAMGVVAFGTVDATSIDTIEELLERSKVISDAVKAGKLAVVGANYKLELGDIHMVVSHGDL